MPTKEEKVAKQKAANDKARVRTLLIAGRVAEAETYAAERGFDVFSARLAPEYQNAAEPAFIALELARATPPAPVMDVGDDITPAEVTEVMGSSPTTIELNVTPQAMPDWTAVPPPDALSEVNGWPVLTDAVVWGIPPNKSMVIIELPDRRRVSLWRTRNVRYRIFDKLRARIVKTEGDPIYEEVMRPRTAF